MRKILVVLFLFLICSFTSLNAQSYNQNKKVYDVHNYVAQSGDPYNPMVSGLCSFFIPGLGQMLSGETLRGIGFLGGYLLCGGIMMIGFVEFSMSNLLNEDMVSGRGAGFLLTGAIATIGLQVWSIVDAIKVAKVNNMYFQDMRKGNTGVSLEIKPFFDSNNYWGKNSNSVGLSMKVTF